MHGNQCEINHESFIPAHFSATRLHIRAGGLGQRRRFLCTSSDHLLSLTERGDLRPCVPLFACGREIEGKQAEI